MQTYDLLMLLVLGAATLFGFWKGMAWQVASLASLVVSYFAALRFADQLAPMISSQAPWNKFVAMLAIYVGSSFVIWTLFRLVSGIIDKVKLDGFDHQMGAIIGFAKGVLLTIAITFFAVTILPQTQKDTIIASRTGEYIVRFLDRTTAIVPPEVHDIIHPYVERIEQRLDPNGQALPNSGFQAQWPSNPLPNWPAQQGNQTGGFQQSAPQQPSVYDRQPSAWPDQQQSTAPTQQQPIPSWPSQPQTADRPSGAPL
ncbi:MAG: CvpA family protein [Planctomycetota bacterium]